MTAYILPLGVVGPQQLILIAVIILILFGGKKIPELMGGIGKGIKEFKKATTEDDSESSTDKTEQKEQN